MGIKDNAELSLKNLYVNRENLKKNMIGKFVGKNNFRWRGNFIQLCRSCHLSYDFGKIDFLINV